MSIGDCLAKVGIAKEHEDAILKGVNVLTTEKRMSEAFAAERVIKDQLKATDTELADITKQLTPAQAALAEHVAKHGEVEPVMPKQAKLPREEAPITAKEPTEHVVVRKRLLADDAKDMVAGGSAAEAAVDAAIKTNDPVHMARVIGAVNDTKIKSNRERLNANDAIERLNRAMGETLKKSPDAAYNLQLKSAQATDAAREAGQNAREHVEKYIKDVLGGKVSVEWAKIMHAGDFTHTKGADKIDPTYAIRLSVHALDPQGTAFHESAHAFFQMLRDQGNHAILKVLDRAANTAPVMNQLRRLLKDEPEALKQIESNREERMAYMYQFYAKDKITLGSETKGVFAKIKDFIYKVMGMWTNDQRAQHIMEWFHEGEFSKNIGDRNAVSRALMEPGRNSAVEYLKAATQPLGKLGAAVLGTGGERLRATANPALIALADAIQPKYAAATKDVGYIQSALNEQKQRLNEWVKGMKNLTKEEINAAHEAMQRGEVTHADPKVQQAIDATRTALDDAFKYMESNGVKIRDLGFGKDYYPRIWDPEFISRHQDEFKTMLEKYKIAGKFEGDVDRTLANLMARDGSEMGVVVDMPGMQHTKERILKFISAQDAAPFLQKDMFQTINSYMNQAARRAEWAKRFQDDGSGMRKLLDDAKDVHGATQEQIDVAQDFIRGIDGTLGDDIPPVARRVMGNMIVYQNIRLLPLAIFSSLIDAGGIKVRGGTVGDSWNAFKRGALEIPRGFKKNKGVDESYQFAQDIGAIDDATLVHALGSSYTQGMVAEGARKWNDTFFKLNLMEQYNMSMRVSATEAAVRFVARHAGDESKHSARWLSELGLDKSDVIVKDGRPLVKASEFEAHGMSKDDAAAAALKMRGALNRWVDGAILRPNAADKPIWMNDPRFMLIAHLKQFTYAFQNTILKRVWHEAEHGNYAPAMALASYVPTMMAADFVKGLIQGGGSEPDWKKGWDFEDYVWSGVQRAGLLGVGQYGADIAKDIHQGGAGIGAVMGPTYEQFVESIKTLEGNEMFSTFATHSMPANALYSHAFHASATDPNFAE